MQNSNRTKERRQVALEILAYIANHPEAKDGLDGIVEWWILEQRIMVQTTIVKAAVWALVEEGLLLMERNNGSGLTYAVNPERLDEIREMVQNSSRLALVDISGSEEDSEQANVRDHFKGAQWQSA